ncbi:hypothetical protein E2C01_012649 [Portunus trituberculatus]|uniref:Uncharacterized protein n=1 Tax=Portunus trituberculatus TaxID=210409 RepID=A0A5B7DEN5_PORTR|nr:hypothetical protein [Portunus trituberculatus]
MQSSGCNVQRPWLRSGSCRSSPGSTCLALFDPPLPPSPPPVPSAVVTASTHYPPFPHLLSCRPRRHLRSAGELRQRPLRRYRTVFFGGLGERKIIIE